MGALGPGQGCTALIWLLGTDRRYLCRQCAGSMKRLNSITMSTLGCLTDRKLIVSLFPASVSLSNKRLLACFRGDLHTESYYLRNKASRMELRRRNHSICLLRGQLWYLRKAESKVGCIRNSLHPQIKVDLDLTPHTVENVTFNLYWGAPRSKLIIWLETGLSCTPSQYALPWRTRDKYSELSQQIFFLSLSGMIFKKIFWKCRKSS